MKASKTLRAVVAGIALAGFGVTAQADWLDEHLNGFFVEQSNLDGNQDTRRGLGVHYIPTGMETGILFLAYYTYHPTTGEPIWLVGNAGVAPGQFSVDMDFAVVSGGEFGDIGPNFPGAGGDVVGTATFTFNTCGNIGLSFSATDQDYSDFDQTYNNVSDITGFASNQCVYNTEFAGCPTFATAVPGEDRACAIMGELTESATLTNDTLWYGLGRVYVGNQDTTDGTDNEGVVLTIEPGTRIVWGDDGNPDAGLFVQMGAKLVAEGTRSAPIVMAGPLNADEAPAGGQQWGGLIIHGRAPVNVCEGVGCAENEVDSSLYGGDAPNESSGSVRFLRVQNAGGDIDQDPERQYNGVAFHGVGRGTTFEYVQVHDNRDDAFEWFGGTNNARYLVATHMGDDGLDWVQGWQGRVQNALVVRNPDVGAPASEDPRSIEADGLSSNNNAEPRSKPWIANATFIANGISDGIVIRRGSGANLSNVLVTGGGECLNLRDVSTFEYGGTPNALSGNLTINNSIVGGCTTPFADDNPGSYTTEQWFNAQDGNTVEAVTLDGVFLEDGSEHLEGADLPFSLFDDFFTNEDYVGAFGTTSGELNWATGWILQDLNTYLQ